MYDGKGDRGGGANGRQIYYGGGNKGVGERREKEILWGLRMMERKYYMERK